MENEELSKEDLRNVWDNYIFAAKGWSYTEAAKKLERNISAVTRLVNGTTTDKETIMRAFKVIIENDPHLRAAIPSDLREKFRKYYDLDKNWWEEICSRLIEKPPEEETLSYEESIKRIEQYIKGERSDPILRGVLLPDQWKKRNERIETHLMRPLENIKRLFQGSSEDDQNEENKI